LRKLNPELSKYKLQVILARSYGYHVSTSTIGRIIRRYDLFFVAPMKPKGHPGRRKHRGVRKPYDLKVTGPGHLIEVDVKHLPGLGNKHYGFCAIDVFTKQATVHVASNISSHQAAIAWAKTVEKFGFPMAVLTDNGSENFGAFSELVSTLRPDWESRRNTARKRRAESSSACRSSTMWYSFRSRR
jgi:integrase-like protein